MAGKKSKILIVDDNQDVAKSWQRELVCEGYEVSLATSVQEAEQKLEKAKQQKSNYHAVICDATLDKENDGVAFLRRAKAAHRDIKPILFSARRADDFHIPTSAKYMDALGRDKGDYIYSDNYCKPENIQLRRVSVTKKPLRLPRGTITIEKSDPSWFNTLLASLASSPKKS